jgi:ribosomal protein S18 acetylase RimI-like enzyme
MTNGAVRIRQFRMSDYDAVTKLWEEAGLHYRPHGRDSRERISAEIKNGIAIFLVAEAEKQVIGTVLGTHDGRKGWVNRLAVAGDWQRRGLAKRLVMEVEKRLGRLGLSVIACLIEKDNAASMRLFKGMGYEKWDGFYFSKRKHISS